VSALRGCSRSSQSYPLSQPVLLGALAAGARILLTGDMAHFGHLMGGDIAGVRVLLPGTYLRERGTW
jgi:hypothetical protein